MTPEEREPGQSRMDLLYGKNSPRPEFACRIVLRWWERWFLSARSFFRKLVKR